MTPSRIVQVEHLSAVAEIVAALPQGVQLVRLDGFMGVGKSCLGRELAKEIGGVLIDGDDFASPSDVERAYINCLRLNDLRTAAFEAASNGVAVLAAVCSKDVVPPQDSVTEFCVYLKRLSFSTPNWPYWHCDPDVEERPARALERSIHEYHLTHRPHVASDLVLEIPEEGHSLNGPVY